MSDVVVFLEYMADAGRWFLALSAVFAATAAVNYPLDRKVREHE